MLRWSVILPASGGERGVRHRGRRGQQGEKDEEEEIGEGRRRQLET
jgi:hypothetical protein